MRRARHAAVFLALLGFGCGDPEAQVAKAAARVAPPRTRNAPVRETPAAVAPRPAPRYICNLLTDQDASEAMGQPVKADFSGDPSSQCSFKIEGAGSPFSISVADNAPDFYQLTAADGARMVDVGDRAVWLGGSLHVISGRRRLTVQMAEGFGDEDTRRRNAQAIAGAVLKRIGPG